jgi:peptidyl-prolyl cis-trans isomerase A (cyclophilin A)
MDVVEKIGDVPTDSDDKPLNDIEIESIDVDTE